MGVSYLPFPLNEETAGWLIESGLSVSVPDIASRLPTLHELQTVVADLSGYTVEASRGRRTIDIEIVDERGYNAGLSTTIWASKATDRTRPPEECDAVRFDFHKGSPRLALMIIERLARTCGPMVVIETAGSRPILVAEGIDIEGAIHEWLI